MRFISLGNKEFIMGFSEPLEDGKWRYIAEMRATCCNQKGTFSQTETNLTNKWTEYEAMKSEYGYLVPFDESLTGAMTVSMSEFWGRHCFNLW